MSVSRNTLYNLGGALTPVFVALVTVPLYLHRIGEARYGVLAIVWLTLGYFGAFDLGLSRAVTNRIAQLRNADHEEREQIFWTACILTAALGIAVAVIFYGLCDALFFQWFKGLNALRYEAHRALPWMALAVPIATVTAALTGSLEGMQEFSRVNKIQAVGTILFQVIPLVVAIVIGPGLQYVIPAAVIVRLITAMPLASAVRTTLPLRGRPAIHRRYIRALFSYGGWIAVTNFVGPILQAFDRILIGIVLGASSVSYYVVPSQLVNRLQILPGALSRALFPHLSETEAEASRRTAVVAVTRLASITTPAIIVALFAIAPFLNIWVGAHFAAHSVAVGEILLIGIWVNGLAYVPLALLQAQGRPDLVAKFHLLETVPFLAILWYGLHWFGVVGAAVAWDLRVCADAIILFCAAGMAGDLVKSIIPAIVGITIAGVFVPWFAGPFSASRIYAGLAFVFPCGIWLFLVNPEIRAFLARRVWSR